MRMDEFLVPDVNMSADETSILKENDFPDVQNKCDPLETRQDEIEKEAVQPDSGGPKSPEQSNCVDQDLNDKVESNDHVESNHKEDSNDKVVDSNDQLESDNIVNSEDKVKSNDEVESEDKVESNENVETKDQETANEEVTTPEVSLQDTEEVNKIGEEPEKTDSEINHNVSDVMNPEIIPDGGPEANKENTVAVPNNIEPKANEFVTRLLIDAQIPDNYTPEEYEEQVKMFGPSHQAVEFLRIHCTACNEHLGSAPNMQHRRYIHPLLRVIICKKCFDFYGSGDFDKDVDGSELYCRWCGQGGNVLCCAQCPYVFCKKCIRTNLGKRKLAQIRDSDDWTCFVCRPQELRKLRIICKALYDYVQEKLANPDPEQLKLDHSMCCYNKVKPFMAQKHKADSDEEINFLPKKKMKPDHPNSAAPVVWQSEVEDEVVCTPDLSLLMNDDDDEEILDTTLDTPNDHMADPTIDPAFDPSTSASPEYVVSDVSPQSTDEVKFISQTRVTRTVPILPKTNILAYKLSTPATSKPNTAIMPNLIQLQKPSITYSTIEPSNTIPNVNRINATIKTPPSSRLAPGLKYEWFDKAAQNTARINRNLSSRLCVLSKQQITVTTLEGLANVHNSLQEILSTSVNNLMQIRKNLKNDFIAGLKKLKFCKLNEVNQNNEISSVNLDDDDDVILVDNNTSPTKTNTTPTVEPEKSKGYLKVKPISELFEKADTRSLPPPLAALKPLNGPTQVNNSVITSSPIKKIVGVNQIKKTVGIGPLKKTVGPIKRTTIFPVKKAYVDMKKGNLKVQNLKFKTYGVSGDALNAMLRVRVIVLKDFGKGTPKTHPLKSYVAFKFDESLNGELRKESVAVNGEKVV